MENYRPVKSINYDIYLLVEFEDWCDLIEYVAYRISQNSNNILFSFMDLITAIVDSHYKHFREDKIIITGIL